MAVLLKGADVVGRLKENMLKDVDELKREGITPRLAIVRVGARPDDVAYEKGAVKRCEGVGIECSVFEFPESIVQKDLIAEIEKINADDSIHGILLFRPLPHGLDENIIKYVISPDKDIDCLNPVNVAKVFEGDESGFAPCTPEAVMDLLEYNGIDLKGKRVTVIGRSLVVGKPLAMMLLKKHATVTLCHTRTADLKGTCKNAEILIAAAGKAKMVDEGFVSEGQIIIDVGINMDENGKLCGDVDLEKVKDIAAAITPVPGGIGTVTTSVLAKHVVRAAKVKASAQLP